MYTTVSIHGEQKLSELSQVGDVTEQCGVVMTWRL